MSRLLLKTNIDSSVTVTKSLIQKILVKVPVLSEPAPKVVKMQAEPVSVKTIYVYKDETKKKLPPKDIQDALQQKVISTSTDSLDEQSQTITTLLASAGESQALVQAEPLPWFAVGYQGEAPFDLLEKFDGPIVRIQAQHNLVQLKSQHFHVMAGGDMPVPILGVAGKPDADAGRRARGMVQKKPPPD